MLILHLAVFSFIFLLCFIFYTSYTFLDQSNKMCAINVFNWIHWRSRIEHSVTWLKTWRMYLLSSLIGNTLSAYLFNLFLCLWHADRQTPFINSKLFSTAIQCCCFYAWGTNSLLKMTLENWPLHSEQKLRSPFPLSSLKKCFKLILDLLLCKMFKLAALFFLIFCLILFYSVNFVANIFLLFKTWKI